MKAVTLIFPHQLFKEQPAIASERKIYLVEETLFFNQYNFNKQKLLLHRASMKAYEAYLTKKEFDVIYIDAQQPASDVHCSGALCIYIVTSFQKIRGSACCLKLLIRCRLQKEIAILKRRKNF